MEIDTAKPNNPTPPSENVAGFQLTLLFSNSRYNTKLTPFVARGPCASQG